MRRAILVGVVAIAAWNIAYLGWSTTPASFDFLALYASARLVVTGDAAKITDRDAILAVEHETRPERTRFLNNPNPPAVSALLAPLGLLPFELAYPVMLTLLVLALAAAAFLLAPPVDAHERAWLFTAAMLSPPSLIALIQGQTTPLLLLAVAASLRVPARWSGLLLATTALRPQFLPLFAVVALADRERRWPFVAGVAAVATLSLALVGVAGIPGYIDLLASSAAELRPGDLGIASLVRRVAGGEDATVSLVLSGLALVIAAIVLLRASPERRTALASALSLVASPHALPHDGVLAYPAVADASRTRLAARGWALSGIVASAIHQAGVPIASLWLIALSARSLDRTRARSSPPTPLSSR